MEQINEGFDQVGKIISYLKSHMEEIKRTLTQKKLELLRVKSLSDIKRKIEEWSEEFGVDPQPMLQVVSSEKLQRRFSSRSMNESEGKAYAINWTLMAACVYVVFHFIVGSSRGSSGLNWWVFALLVLLITKIGLLVSMLIGAFYAEDDKAEVEDKPYMYVEGKVRETVRELIKEVVGEILTEGDGGPDPDSTHWTASDISYLEGEDMNYDDDDDSFLKSFYRDEYLLMVQKTSKEKYEIRLLRKKKRGSGFDVAYSEVARSYSDMMSCLKSAKRSIE